MAAQSDRDPPSDRSAAMAAVAAVAERLEKIQEQHGKDLDTMLRLAQQTESNVTRLANATNIIN